MDAIEAVVVSRDTSNVQQCRIMDLLYRMNRFLTSTLHGSCFFEKDGERFMLFLRNYWHSSQCICRKVLSNIGFCLDLFVLSDTDIEQAFYLCDERCTGSFSPFPNLIFNVSKSKTVKEIQVISESEVEFRL